jgi:hypothetical protein
MNSLKSSSQPLTGPPDGNVSVLLNHETEEVIIYGYCRNTIEFACKYDNVDSLVQYFMVPQFNFLQTASISPLDLPFIDEISFQSLLSFTAFYAASQCFAVLLVNTNGLCEDSTSSSIKGGNFQIITAIEHLHGDFASQFSVAIFYWRNNIADWILANYEVKGVDPVTCILSMNYQGLSFVLSNFMNQLNIQNLVCTAARHGYYYFVVCMISTLRADVNTPNDLGEFALHLSGEYGHFKVFTYLILHGANVNQIDKTGATALALATKNGFTNLVIHILSHGAEPNISPNNQLVPLFLAVKSGFFEIVKILVDHGAIIDTFLSDGFSLLMVGI